MKNKNENKKTLKKIAIFVCAVICLATLLSVCALTLTSCADKWTGEAAYVQVSKKGDKINVEIPVGDGVDSKNVFLFGINMWESGAELGGIAPLCEAKVKGSKATAEIEVSGNLSEMLCKGYLFAKRDDAGAFVPLTGVYYATNPGNSHGKNKVDEDGYPTGMKGTVGSVADALDLESSSAVVTVNLSDLMSAEGGKGTIPYVWSGLTYYANRDAIESLDKQIKGYTDAGVYVYLEIVQTTPREKLSGGLKTVVLDAPAGKNGYALNMYDREGASRICGMFDLLAGRYGSGGENGKASAFIIGRNVNNLGQWYAGDSGDGAVLNYAKAVRAAYNILLAHTPDGRVYISVNNNWNVADSGNFTVRDMMVSFNNQVGTEGDFFWQVAIEANASDPSDSSIWDDPQATGKSDFISPANIETLVNQLSTDMYKCGGMQRHVLLNRFYVGGSDEKYRTASYAFAYYKCLYTGSVDGLLYDAIRESNAAMLGVIAGIDDENCPDLSFVSAVIGEKWDRIYKKLSKDAGIRATERSTNGADHSYDGVTVITDFSSGDTFGFKPLDADYVELRYSEARGKAALYAPISAGGERAGVVSSSLSRKALKEVGYLGVTAMIESSATDAVVTLRLSGYDKKGIEHVFVGETTVATGAWTSVYFDVQDFVKKIDSDTVTVSVTTLSQLGETDGIWLSEMVTEAPMKGGFPMWIIVVLIVLAVVGGCVAFVMWFRKNYTFVRE